MQGKTIDAWAKDEQRRIDGFVKWWKKMQAEAPDEEKPLWPLRIPMGEWDEQYRCYTGG